MKKNIKYLTVKELSEKWDIPERTIRNYCVRGDIEGAIINGKTWFIPGDVRKINKKKTKINYLLSRLK